MTQVYIVTAMEPDGDNDDDPEADAVFARQDQAECYIRRKARTQLGDDVTIERKLAGLYFEAFEDEDDSDPVMQYFVQAIDLIDECDNDECEWDECDLSDPEPEPGTYVINGEEFDVHNG